MEEMREDLQQEYDAIFTDDEKASNILKLTSDSFTRNVEKIKLKTIGFTKPVQLGRKDTLSGLTATIKDLGVLTPIQVMKVEDDMADDDYQYILLDGLRRVYGALKNGQEEIDAVVWTFEDYDKGTDVSLIISLLLNRVQKRTWREIWDLYKVLEMQDNFTPGTLEFLLQLEGGDAMKLKDVMLCEYEEVKQALLNNEKNLEACYKMLQKLRKEEDALSKEDAMGVSDISENAEEITGDNMESEEGQLSDSDVRELLEMSEDMDNLEDISEEDFDALNSGVADSQAGGNRHPLDPALKSAVLNRDDFKCQCCGFGGAAALGVLAVHHKIPVHTFAKGQSTDYMDNLITLCLNHHILLHVAERNGGKLHMTKEEFEAYPEQEQAALKKCLALARVAVEADKRRHISLEDVKKATTESIKHPMPGAGLKDNRDAYLSSKRVQNIDLEDSDLD